MDSCSVLTPSLWVVRVGGNDGELRPWHYIYVYSIESRLTAVTPHQDLDVPDPIAFAVRSGGPGLV